MKCDVDTMAGSAAKGGRSARGKHTMRTYWIPQIYKRSRLLAAYSGIEAKVRLGIFYDEIISRHFVTTAT